MSYMKVLFISLALMVMMTANALALLPAGLADDLARIDGLILKVSEDEVLIDAASIKGVRIGDLFTVVGKSEKIIHPVTGAVLGEREHRNGMLQVVWVGSGYSVTRVLAGDPPPVGATVVRNQQVEASFVDLGTGGERFFKEIQQAFAQLLWTGYKRADQQGVETMRLHGSGFNGLLFLLEGDRLEIRGPAFELLHSYDHIDPQLPAPSSQVLTATPSVPAPVPVQRVPLTVPATPSVGGLAPLWSGMAAKGLPVGLVVLDLDNDGKQEIARAFENRIEIGRLIGERYAPLQTIELARGEQLLSISAFDLNANGKPEMFVTVIGANGLNSQVLEYRDGNYQRLADNLRWFINVVTLPGEGEVVLGQEHDLSYRGFSPTVFRLSWQEERLSRATAYMLPEHGTIFSLTALPGNQSDRMLRINQDGRLEIYAQLDEPLWVSSDSGSSETGYSQPDPESPGGVDELSNYIYLPTPLLALGDGSVLTLMNGGDMVSGLFRQMTSVEIALRKWDGVDLRQVWLQKLDGYVPAAVMADANNDGNEELTLLLAFPTSNPFASRKSAVRLYEIK